MFKLQTAKSAKTGKEYTYLSVKIGAYEGRLFPTPAECEYLKEQLKQQAHADFKDDLDDEFANEE